MKIIIAILLILSFTICQDITSEWEMLGFTFNSKIVGDNIQIKVEGNHKGWVGIGYGQGMDSVDMNVVSFEQNNVIVNDCWGVGIGQVQIDKDNSGASNVELIGDKTYNAQTGAWSFTIQRPIKKTDNSLDGDIDITKGANSYFSVALGRELEFDVTKSSHENTNIKQIQYQKAETNTQPEEQQQNNANNGETSNTSQNRLQNLIVSSLLIIGILIC